jgi:hypothetical protein
MNKERKFLIKKMWLLFYSNHKDFYELIKNICYCQNKKII